ncbi:MAG: tryptophan 7-halogenase, partial [Planctomycetota bacterium]|nr:tryptophan 7-halogenase [Planctomycetota bacterium]
YLQELGIEDEVRAYSIYKPGATFVLRGGKQVMNLRFDTIRGAKTTYSYNVPRDKLDASILAAAERAGAHLVRAGARVEPTGEGERIRLSDETLRAAEGVFGGSQPDFIVDATGRRRTLARLFDLPTETGPRRDAALHAHMEDVGLIECGNVHTDVLERGWSWRIPLQGKVSVGLVVPGQELAKFGDTAEEQFDRYLAHDKVVSQWDGAGRRTSPVLKYTNYQLLTRRGFGPNWALLGDAFGFIDPVFSSGMLIGMDGARSLAKVIAQGAPEKGLERYQAHVIHHLETWQRVVDHFYNGRLFTLLQVGEIARTTRFGAVMDLHFGRYMPRVFTGEASNGRYGPWLLDFMCRRGLIDNDPAELAVA